DVVDPVWIRLFSFSGFNQLFSFPGTILSGRAAYEVYKHMDLLKSKSYNLTKAAAIRMVSFSFLFAFINFLACISSFIAIIKGYPFEKEPNSLDFI
ncbi:14617_t:CDS:2, partial [Racocetra persica]